MRKLLMTCFIAILITVTNAATNVAFAESISVKVGVLIPLEGSYTVLGEDAQRGVELALRQSADSAEKIIPVIITGVTDGTGESILRVAKQLVEVDKVDVVIGTLNGSAGLILREYAKTRPQIAFINGVSSSPETTLVNPADNFFRFNTDAAQWNAGLGGYVYSKKGWQTIASVAEDSSFSHANFFGFAHGFCKAGGQILKREWTESGLNDFKNIIASLPEKVDAIYLGLPGSVALKFIEQYRQTGGQANFIGGSSTVDGTILSITGEVRQIVKGMPSAGPQADHWNDPEWQAFVKAYRDAFAAETRFSGPSILATGYYNATSAMLQCIKKTGGNISDNQSALRQCLATLELDAPNGMIALDDNRQAIGSNFIVEVVEKEGRLLTQLVSRLEGVSQTLGEEEDKFSELGLPSRGSIACN